jgi:hypothetical protein
MYNKKTRKASFKKIEKIKKKKKVIDPLYLIIQLLENLFSLIANKLLAAFFRIINNEKMNEISSIDTLSITNQL